MEGKDRTSLVKLVDGQATFALGRFARAGSRDVTLRYLGSALAKPVTKTVTLKVRRR